MRMLKLDTLQDAYGVIRHYGLDRFDWGAGSAQGFADRLFIGGSEVLSLEGLGNEMARYLEELHHSPNLDEMLKVERIDTEASLVAYMAKRAELAELVREIKWTSGSGEAWDLVAHLATVGSAHGQLSEVQATGLLPAVRASIAALGAREELLQTWASSDYKPGRSDILDGLVRHGLRKLDEYLLALPAWTGKEPEMSFEVTALVLLLRDEDFRQRLDMLAGKA